MVLGFRVYTAVSGLGIESLWLVLLLIEVAMFQTLEGVLRSTCRSRVPTL
jgi:hypothetical protein